MRSWRRHHEGNEPLGGRPPELRAPRRWLRSLSGAEVFVEVVEGICLGRMTASRKPIGGVRGIIVGDTFRRAVSRSVAGSIPKCWLRYRCWGFGVSDCIDESNRSRCIQDEISNATTVDSVQYGCFLRPAEVLIQVNRKARYGHRGQRVGCAGSAE